MIDLVTIKNHSNFIEALQFIPQTVTSLQVLMLSPNKSDIKLIKTIFPTAVLYVSNIQDWNLDTPPPFKIGRFDCVIAQNVFLYSKIPSVWFNHVLSISNIIVIQDIKYRKRSFNYPYLGLDGDSTRYSLFVNSKVSFQPTNRISKFGEVIYYKEFNGALNEFHKPNDQPIHFSAILKSNNYLLNAYSEESLLRVQLRANAYMLDLLPFPFLFKAYIMIMTYLKKFITFSNLNIYTYLRK